ncbi:hypothetical protein [Moorena sp. SIO4G3]|nr:hypothetical protein [Moorena sp. SIO4G3]NEO80692.1 hypothetical protein [Moorena sp. SIO4G3]
MLVATEQEASLYILTAFLSCSLFCLPCSLFPVPCSLPKGKKNFLSLF